MSATDYDGARPRLDGVRADITAIADALPGARYSIIGFDSTATRQLPLTTDVRAVRSWAQTLHTELTAYSTGSLIDRPLDALVDALQSSRESFPDDQRYVFFFSDGENTTDGTPASFAPAAPLIDGGAVLGYGTAKGATMTTYDPSSSDDGAPILDYSQPGAPEAVSRIDEDQLRTVAEQLGVPYAHRTGGTQSDGGTADEPVTTLVSGIDLSHVAQVGQRKVTVHQYVVWPLALLAAALLVWELAGAVRRATRPVIGGERG
jgi:Ca-activated chloride channel family protein